LLCFVVMLVFDHRFIAEPDDDLFGSWGGHCSLYLRSFAGKRHSVGIRFLPFSLVDHHERRDVRCIVEKRL